MFIFTIQIMYLFHQKPLRKFIRRLRWLSILRIRIRASCTRLVNGLKSHTECTLPKAWCGIIRPPEKVWITEYELDRLGFWVRSGYVIGVPLRWRRVKCWGWKNVTFVEKNIRSDLDVKRPISRVVKDEDTRKSRGRIKRRAGLDTKFRISSKKHEWDGW